MGWIVRKLSDRHRVDHTQLVSAQLYLLILTLEDILDHTIQIFIHFCSFLSSIEFFCKLNLIFFLNPLFCDERLLTCKISLVTDRVKVTKIMWITITFRTGLRLLPIAQLVKFSLNLANFDQANKIKVVFQNILHSYLHFVQAWPNFRVHIYKLFAAPNWMHTPFETTPNVVSKQFKRWVIRPSWHWATFLNTPERIRFLIHWYVSLEFVENF